ncbi:restriction endonuclease subunit S [Aeromonas caviae]|uniref:restriction endonuclease subunit S n=1 Tax=Aeromonas caviae TaxID=648 RepID=UPI000690E8EF|nr:restriction endonuclease subunit S [Aeromonas caviae]AXB02811.1 restriction endonuclease subunit S [Aeromonas caviae]MDK3164759.1 restriction endonuclease subunit S [Aeromonas caviae]PNO56960.1 restriction endonuclease subunit S [Aeromonas caviae]QLL81028.1 restriction endonuclease subunit S [Aeromonas caviae]QUM00043.1 restriction endonuclease subunit S [Aeromonas caviae]
MAEQMIQHKEGEKVATQAIPTGYKQTEVGVIPKDWEVMLVGDSFTVCNNLRLPISSKVRDGMNGSYPYYGPTKIQGYINEYRVEGEFALIGEDGDHFLKFDSVNQTQLVSGKFNVNNHAHLIKGDVGSAKWFYWFFRNRDISIYLTRQGAGRFKLNKASLERIQCAIPPTEEQLAIAKVLSDSDALIVSLEQLITKKQAIKTAAMQQLLTGRTRMPQFALRADGTPKGYKTSELGQIPEDWTIETLGGVTEIVRNGSNYSSVAKDGVAVTRIETIATGYVDVGRTGVAVRESIHESYRVLRGDILYSHINSIDHIGKVARFDDDIELFHGINLILIRTSAVNSLWLFKLLSGEEARKWARQVAKQAVSQASINTKELKGLLLAVPSTQEQTTIATILSDMDSELTALEQKLTKARDVKQGMMQQLLTGRIRLPLPQEA